MHNWFKRLLNKLGWYNTNQVLELCESASYLYLANDWPKVFACNRYFVVLPEDAAKNGWQQGQEVTLHELAEALINADLHYRAKIAEGSTEQPPVGYST